MNEIIVLHKFYLITVELMHTINLQVVKLFKNWPVIMGRGQRVTGE